MRQIGIWYNPQSRREATSQEDRYMVVSELVHGGQKSFAALVEELNPVRYKKKANVPPYI